MFAGEGCGAGDDEEEVNMRRMMDRNGWNVGEQPGDTWG